jgi:hypothetical protein
MGAKNHGGYGVMTVSGGAQKRATHIAMLLFHGVRVPRGSIVCHHCDNPSCVNPEHLFLGTHRTNADDMRSKGRSKYQSRIHMRRIATGESNGHASLNENMVRTIRNRVASGEQQIRIAADLGISASAVNHVWRRTSWKHVP